MAQVLLSSPIFVSSILDPLFSMGFWVMRIKKRINRYTELWVHLPNVFGGRLALANPVCQVEGLVDGTNNYSQSQPQ